MSHPVFYTNLLSAKAGDTVHLHISAEYSPCQVEICRVAATKTSVMQIQNIRTGIYKTPENASEKGCNWPIASSITIPGDWLSGYYDIVLTDSKGNSSHHFIVVKASEPKSKAVIVLATNTYQTYNYWGGFNAYANVAGLMSGQLDLPSAMEQAIGNLSSQRPFAQNIVNAPEGLPRLINYRKRDFQEPPFAIDPAMAQQTEFSPFDGSAGFINKWEHLFVRWAEQNNVSLDYLTDKDLNDDPEALSGYKAVLVAGHSEYWSAGQRDALDSFVQDGGNLCIFSGNTCYWKVRWEDNGETLVSHKWLGHQNDPLWANAETRQDATHLWSHPEFNRPETETIGLSFMYGGYHRLGNCAARGQAGFTIVEEDHWTLQGTDLFYGDVFGDDIPLIGYECDGAPLQFDSKGNLIAGEGPGVPDNLQIIATAPVVLGESTHSGYPPVIPPEKLDAIAKIRLGSDTHENREAVRKGHAVIAAFSKGKGQVFNTSTTEWVHGLASGDPYINKITQNVFEAFGIIAS